MNLTSYGCSFIFGIDMQDAEMIPNTPGKPSQLTWPALLAQHMGLNYRCRAHPGCGNLLIAERILLDLDLLCKNTQLVVVGWTWIDRFDYNDPGHMDNWNTIRPSADDANAEFYFRNLHSEYRDKLASLMAIKLVIDTFNQKKLPFLMTYMDDLLFDQSFHVSESIKYLQNYIRPHMTSFENQTFLEWSRSNNYPVSKHWHPLEVAHAAAGEYIINQHKENQ